MDMAEYCKQLGWNISDLARFAKLERHTARRALREGVVSARTARKISAAFSDALGHQVNPGDIQGLSIRG